MMHTCHMCNRVGALYIIIYAVLSAIYSQIVIYGHCLKIRKHFKFTVCCIMVNHWELVIFEVGAITKRKYTPSSSVDPGTKKTC